MASMTSNISALASYRQLAMDRVVLSIVYLVTNHEKYKNMETANSKLLEGCKWGSGQIVGDIDPTKVCDVIEQAMALVKGVYWAGLLMTGSLVFLSRAISILPIIPSFLFLVAVIMGAITWDIHAVLREMHHAYFHFSVLAKSKQSQMSFDTFVNQINDYSHRILVATWIISGWDVVATTLTDLRPTFETHIQTQSTETPKKAGLFGLLGGNTVSIW